jgi:hypothetical protein
VIAEPLDAWLFAQINAGNCISLPLNQNFGWAADVRLRHVFDRYFEVESGAGYPPHRAEPQKAFREKLEEISQNGKSAGFLRKAQNAVLQGIDAADKGDYSALGKIIAQGLIQNNNVLLDQKQLDDRFTIYATLGGRVLDFMKGNEQLRQAVLNHLDGDIKQLDIANAARNISNLRTEIMPRYLEMLSQYGATHMVTYRDKNGVERSDKDFLVPGNKRNVAKVCQLFNIDLQMRKGEFDLRTTEYVNDGTADMLAALLDRSQVLAAFLVDKNRVDRLKDPMAMKSLYTEALAEYQNKRAQQGNQKELVKEIENQPKEKVGEVSVG